MTAIDHPVFAGVVCGVLGNITPSDSGTLTKPGKGFRVYSGAGDVTCIMLDGSTQTYHSFQLYEKFGGLIKQVKSTGTTATGIDVYY